MLDAGMNVARLNFSHGDHKTHGQSLDNLREALKLRKGSDVEYIREVLGEKGAHIKIISKIEN